MLTLYGRKQRCRLNSTFVFSGDKNTEKPIIELNVITANVRKESDHEEHHVF